MRSCNTPRLKRKIEIPRINKQADRNRSILLIQRELPPPPFGMDGTRCEFGKALESTVSSNYILIGNWWISRNFAIEQIEINVGKEVLPGLVPTVLFIPRNYA